MSKFLYLQDFHISGRTPINRKDNYYLSMLKKLDEIIELGKKYKVKYILDGGDVFDVPMISNLILDEFIDKIEASNIPWKMIWGNHTEIGHNPELSKASSLAHTFRRSKLISHLDYIEDKKTNTFIKGYDYTHNCEEKIKNEGLICPKKAKFKIAIVHSMITEKQLMPQIMHIPIKNIKTNFDLVLIAHNHVQKTNIIKQNGVNFIFLGALGRTSIDEISIIPQVALIDTETKEIKLIPLKSAKKGEDVFDLEKVEKTKEFNAEIDNFIKSLENSKDLGLDINGIIEYLAKEKHIDNQVKDCVIKRIGELS